LCIWTQLKSYQKKIFDPFCRRNRIAFQYDPNDSSKTICTTVGQLNFFKWAIENKVIDYLRKHIDAVEKHMNQQEQVKTKKQIKKHEVVIVLTFN